MEDNKKISIYFIRFKIRMLVVNPYVDFKPEDWNNNKKINGFCKLHNTSFSMYKGVDMMLYNCPICHSMQKMSKEDKETLITKLKNLEFEEYQDKINNGLAIDTNIIVK